MIFPPTSKNGKRRQSDSHLRKFFRFMPSASPNYPSGGIIRVLAVRRRDWGSPFAYPPMMSQSFSRRLLMKSAIPSDLLKLKECFEAWPPQVGFGAGAAEKWFERESVVSDRTRLNTSIQRCAARRMEAPGA